jgi:DNA-directed RNA polymerase subunit beta'
VTSVSENLRESALTQLETEYKNKQKEIQNAESEMKKRDVAMESLKEQYVTAKDEIKSLHPMQILSEIEYYNLSSRFGQVFNAGIGAEAVRTLLASIDIPTTLSDLEAALPETEGEAKKRVLQRIKLFQGFQKSGLKLEWMFPTTLPVIPPDLRPMVALDGGRFATSDVNDLYRRIINRNNRLQKLMEIGAPEVITRNEKRMLQEAVDALFDNTARKGQAAVSATTGQKRPLRSLADSLKGKQGRFRQNLLGKRVDYSGRSVIVVGPKLKLYQCGLPKKMALELFKPFIIQKLIEKEMAHNVRTAGRMVDSETEESYEILDEIIPHHYVLLNRAPTLHRLSIQAFRPVLIEGKAIRLHPMVCEAFNADFDGDQMAVHVPLTAEARKESAELMLSSKNLLKPSSGDPIVGARLDMVLGAYYMTHTVAGAKGEGKAFGSIEEAIFAYENGIVAINAKIKLLYGGELIETSAGRAMMNDILPESQRYVNKELTRKDTKEMMSRLILEVGQDEAALFADRLKDVTFRMVSKSGLSWGMDDLKIPDMKVEIMAEAEIKAAEVKEQFDMGFLTNDERRRQMIGVWTDTKNKMTEAVRATIDPEGPVHAMIHSKARGSESVVVQMTGMKGLLAGPTGEIIELPVKSSLKEGLNVLEYFISTHGSRKGLADTALRTASAGYLTRRLVDVAQDVIVQNEDCGEKDGTWIYRADTDSFGMSFASRVEGRFATETIKDAEGNELAKKGKIITREGARAIERLEIDKVKIRTLVTCQNLRGVCQKCYGIDLGRAKLVEEGATVGIVAAQAIGEPGTQLTMRTFHLGGIAGSDITQGLPRVEEILEARVPKSEGVLCEVDGHVMQMSKSDKSTTIIMKGMEGSEHEYEVPNHLTLLVKEGDVVSAGTQLCEGHQDLQKLYNLKGRDAIHRYIIRSIAEIYAAQGEGLNDKHMEVIIRQMLSRIRISKAGDTELLPGDIIERDIYLATNEKAKVEGKEVAEGTPEIMGITRVALSTDSFLSSASFMETARVLIGAAVSGKSDSLRGLKENVIIGRLIPAGTGFRVGQKDAE